MSPQFHQIKKPRLSLSCIVCRRRKVRCGREQPQCANCVRMKEDCEYRTMVRDESTGRVREISQDEDHGSDPRSNHSDDPMELTWSHWMSPSVNPGPARSRLPEPSTSTAQDFSPEESTSSPNYLSLRQGARARYVGRAFWGFVPGKESLSDDFFDENRHASPGLPLPHISSMGMFNLLRSLPTKPVSDALLKAFFLTVWPLSPIVHSPTLQADYNEFWDWCENSNRSLPSRKIRDDPTFFCLLFAMLYCGAAAVPADSWMPTNLQGQQKETVVNDLKAAYTTSLSLCQNLEHPTLNTLVSAILTGPFLDRPHEPMRNLITISTTVRIAQSMGLHQEKAWSALSPVDRDIQRRVWWHIVSLDVQSSISTGLPLCCGNDALEAVSMVTDTRNENINDLPSSLSPQATTVASEQSVAMILAIGRFETARLQSKIVAHLQSGQRPAKNRLGELSSGAEQLQQRIDKLIARLPAQGIPEQGLIPSRLANVSPSTHPLLYKDDANEPTVLSAWVRIILTLLKYEVAILLQKLLLAPPDSTNSQSCKSWTSIAQHCVSYLRIFLQLYRTPAFSPYLWFCRNHYGPLQSVFLILMYLQHFDNTDEIPLARYYVEEAIYHLVSYYKYPHTSSARVNAVDPELDARIPLAIQVLVDLHNRLQPPHSNSHPPPEITSSKPRPPNSLFGGRSGSGLDLDLLENIPDLETLSSLLNIQSGDILTGPGV